jgi:hypothetical protein
MTPTTTEDGDISIGDPRIRQISAGAEALTDKLEQIDDQIEMLQSVVLNLTKDVERLLREQEKKQKSG